MGLGTTRRVVLTGAGVTAAAVLTGCATDGSAQPPRGADPPAGSDPDPTDGPEETQGPLAHTADVPVGGGVVLDQKNMVITQPTKGTFKAFTATCTHQGCQVVEVKGGTIRCPCHGSQFKIADGSVAQGPATRALREIAINVDGADIQEV
jgi:Rieske Fe-S protein